MFGINEYKFYLEYGITNEDNEKSLFTDTLIVDLICLYTNKTGKPFTVPAIGTRESLIEELCYWCCVDFEMIDHKKVRELFNDNKV